VANLLRAMTLEIQMLARACGKSDVHHLEPEDMAALSLEASAICGIPLAGTRKVFGLLTSTTA
jgi:methylamine---glutamate N-methyltransferase subunit C